MPTQAEKRILQKRRQAESNQVLVPLLTELLTHSSLDIEDESDVEWLANLARKQVKRETIRKDSYNKGEMVYSPSGLASCLRRVYLGKNHQKLGLTRVQLPAPEPHFYFFTGDWLHLKWQFAFYKLSLVNPDFLLIDCEIPVSSKRKDHGGTIDVLCIYKKEPLIVDVKGLNVRSFHSVDKGESPHAYRIQVADYGMLLNSAITSGRYKVPSFALEHLGMKSLPKLTRGIILAENKGGPDLNHPVALTEDIIDLKSNMPEVRARLEVLREYESKEEIPPPECISTRFTDFQGCPFAEFCRAEVKQIEAARVEAFDPSKVKLTRSKRRRRS